MASSPSFAGKRFVAELNPFNELSGRTGMRRVESLLRVKDDRILLVGRQKLCLSAPAFWGVRFPSHLLLDRRSPILVTEYTAACVKQVVSSGTTVAFLDPDLRSVLELASDAELSNLSNILYGRSLLSPLLKSLTPGDGAHENTGGEPSNYWTDRDALMVRLEARFLFLAADAKAILRGRRPSYRKVLLQVRKKLRVPCAAYLSTADIESEIFLHLLEKYFRKKIALSQASWNALLKLRTQELLLAILKGGGAMTATRLQQLVFKKLSGKLLLEATRYQVAKHAAVKTGQVAAMIETRVALLAARQGVIGAAKRYLTVQIATMVLVPMLWGTLLADILISAVGTDYARVVQAIYAFAQIRLVHTYDFDDINQ